MNFRMQVFNFNDKENTLYVVTPMNKNNIQNSSCVCLTLYDVKCFIDRFKDRAFYEEKLC